MPAPGKRLALVALAAALIAGCANEQAAKPHLEAAAAILALDRRAEAKVEETPECRAALGPDGESGAAHPTLQTTDGRVVFVSTGAAAAADAGTAAAIVLPAGAKEAAETSRSDIPRVAAAPSRPPPGSALITTRDLPMRLSEVQWAERQMSLLIHQPDAASTLAAAIIRRQGLGPAEHVFVWYPQQSGAKDTRAKVNLAALEHLYVQVMARDPVGAFRFLVAQRGVADLAASEPLSHPALLRRIAMARQCAAAAAARRDAAQPVPWQSLALEPVPEPAAMPGSMDVRARLSGPGGALAARRILFSRLPHLECAAESGPDGVAGCRLIDVMGHEMHPGFESAPTLATFPGDVKAELVMLPTVLVMRQ